MNEKPKREMYWVIRIHSLEGRLLDPATVEMFKVDGIGVDKEYLCEYDPDAHDGQGLMKTTRDLNMAIKFRTSHDAMRFYFKQSTVRPLRADGEPNKPLTAFSASIEVPYEAVRSAFEYMGD